VNLLVNVLLIYLFQIITILPHELAHAIVGRRLGLFVTEVSIGRGKKMFSLPLLGFDVTFRVIQLVGVVRFSHIFSKGLRWRYSLAVLAGPMMNFTLGLAACLFVKWDLDFINTVAVGQVFVISQAFLFFLNLIPFKFITSAGTTPSDGYSLLQLLFSKWPGVIYPPTRYHMDSNGSKTHSSSSITKTR
jgi:membrane-associated protease RseP (regulator of RpoE activity)